MFRSSPPPGSERTPYQILEPPLLNGSVDFSFWTVPISVHPDQSAADMRRYPCPSESPDQQRAPGLVGSALSESTQSTLVLAKLMQDSAFPSQALPRPSVTRICPLRKV